jgi:hypothetical protein
MNADGRRDGRRSFGVVWVLGGELDRAVGSWEGIVVELTLDIPSERAGMMMLRANGEWWMHLSEKTGVNS